MNTQIACLLVVGLATASAPLADNAASGPAAASPPVTLPNGASITPLAPPGISYQALDPGSPTLSVHLADHPAASVLSPDGRTLLVPTSGYNRQFDADGKTRPELSTDYVFVFDVSGKAIAVGRIGSVLGPLADGALLSAAVSVEAPIRTLVPAAAIAGSAVLMVTFQRPAD